MGHLRPPTISKVLYDIIELRYRSFEHNIVVSYYIGTYNIVGNYNIGAGKVPETGAETLSHSGQAKDRGLKQL